MPGSAKNVSVNVRSERTITAPIGSSMEALRHAATSDDNWRLKSISTTTEGHQRDPYTTGVRLTFERVP